MLCSNFNLGRTSSTLHARQAEWSNALCTKYTLPKLVADVVSQGLPIIFQLFPEHETENILSLEDALRGAHSLTQNETFFQLTAAHNYVNAIEMANQAQKLAELEKLGQIMHQEISPNLHNIYKDGETAVVMVPMSWAGIIAHRLKNVWALFEQQDAPMPALKGLSIYCTGARLAKKEEFGIMSACFDHAFQSYLGNSYKELPKLQKDAFLNGIITD